MAQVNSQEVVAWVQLAQQLAVLGINAATGIKNAVKALNPNVDNATLDAIVQATMDDASRRKALAENDAAGRGPQPAAATEGKVGKLGPNGQPLPAAASGPLPSPPPGAGPTGTDGVTGTAAANNVPPAPAGKDGAHSAVDRPDGGLPGTTSAPVDRSSV